MKIQPDKEHKYSSECAIDIFLSTFQILQQSELEFFTKTQQIFNKTNPCNIYFILKRPKTTINPSYLKVDKNWIELMFYIQVQEKKESRLLRIPNNDKTQNIKLHSEYPYNYFTLIINERHSDSFKVGALIDQVQFELPKVEPLLDYEVLYIGQTFGKNGERTPLERISSHSTLQLIYSEAISKNPDSDIWIMLTSFSQKNIASTDGRIKIPKKNEPIDLKRFLNFSDPNYVQFTDKQKINFTEASLIKAFRPKYNKEYKDTFPSKTHKTYSECYDLDINAIVIETDTSALSRWLYTDSKPKGKLNDNGLFNYRQYETFHFVTSDDRHKLFNNEYI
ncbi:hypothetical protein [Zobellia barbeyronii]|uniref:Uncharacterized protein n=1 Tax=Zobellia barbeyronii TaxID=2748009 RepID=A0ABS5WBS6_9FLAO|nr:hypothetical protein [Zobellia barbeyronii]MBT2160860.1 hypothetical protein [Zobellia barbeyronii]